MSPHTLVSAFTGLIFLGINCSACLGAKESQLLPELVDLQENTEPEDNKQNPQLMKVIQQYEPKISEVKNGGKTRLEGAGERIKNLREEDGSEQYLAKRLADIRRGFGDFFKSRPGFRNWGGKRSKFGYGDKRTSFSRWGGKRSKFNNWGGKRGKTEKLVDGDWYLFEKRDPEYSVPYEQRGSEEIVERNGFKTWAGKRASDGGFDGSVIKRYRLFPWTGRIGVRQDEALQEFEKNFWDALNSLNRDESAGDEYSYGGSSEGDAAGLEKIKYHSRSDSR